MKKNNIMGAGVAIGPAIGVAVDSKTNNMGAGLGMGDAIGIIIGTRMNKKKNTNNDGK